MTAPMTPTVSFAKIASADVSLRCNAFITVMEDAQLWDLNDPSDPRDLPRKWTLLVEPQMRSRPVVVSEIVDSACAYQKLHLTLIRIPQDID